MHIIKKTVLIICYVILVAKLCFKWYKLQSAKIKVLRY